MNRHSLRKLETQGLVESYDGEAVAHHERLVRGARTQSHELREPPRSWTPGAEEPPT